jgi:hypothetical protein
MNPHPHISPCWAIIPAIPTSKKFSPLLSDVPLTQNSEMVFQEKSLIPTEDTLFCQDPVLEITEQKIGEKESNKEEEKGDFFHKFGPYTLMDLNHRRDQGQGASSLIQKVNIISCPVD